MGIGLEFSIFQLKSIPNQVNMSNYIPIIYPHMNVSKYFMDFKLVTNNFQNWSSPMLYVYMVFDILVRYM